MSRKDNSNAFNNVGLETLMNIDISLSEVQ
jgi:hypothetical protein